MRGCLKVRRANDEMALAYEPSILRKYDDSQQASIKSNKGMTNIYENKPEEVYTFVYALVSVRIY